jgi:hypothetical protein
MSTFNYKEIKSLLDNNYKIAVETGTFIGKGTKILAKYFLKVYTIEINEKLYLDNFRRFKNKKNIKCLFGNSGNEISKLCDELNNLNTNILFWLDAHFSGDKNTDWEKSNWKGYKIDTGFISNKSKNIIPTSKQQVPLEEEILTIYNNIKNECILYIDDFNKINPKTLKGLKDKSFKGEDWTHLDFNTIFETISDRIIYKKITDDQCIIKFKKLE